MAKYPKYEPCEICGKNADYGHSLCDDCSEKCDYYDENRDVFVMKNGQVINGL